MASPSTAVQLKHTPLKKMPVIALGVYRSTGAEQSCTWAFQTGYRHIDSARVYRNEEEVGRAALTSGLDRHDLWLTTKIVGREHGTQATLDAVKTSTERLGQAAPWDLILLHDPTAGKARRSEAWKVLLQAKKDGKCRAIGVSNYGVKHLKEAKEIGDGVEVNQIELHPWCQQKDIVEYCKAENIVVQAYSPLVQAKRMDDPTLLEVAKREGKTPAQILIRWSLQKGYVPLPKSDQEERIKGNFDVFDFQLSKESMAQLDGLDQGKAGSVTWNPVDHA